MSYKESIMRGGKYFAILIILLINFLGMIKLLSRLKQNYILELFFTAVFLLISLIMLLGIYMDENWGHILSGIFFLLFLINSFFLYKNATHGFIIFSGMILLSTIAFLISVSSIKEKEEEEPDYFDYEKKEPEEEAVEEIKPSKEIKSEPYGVEKKFKPGKYIASKTGTKYHAPKCDWAKKIKKTNAVWFNDKKEAKKAGYKSDSCVK